MVKLAKKQLMLISIKTLTNHNTELLPSDRLNGLVPTRGRALKMHLSNTNPQRTLNAIHAKILLTVLAPTARILTVEGWKGELR